MDVADTLEPQYLDTGKETVTDPSFMEQLDQKWILFSLQRTILLLDAAMDTINIMHTLIIYWHECTMASCILLQLCCS